MALISNFPLAIWHTYRLIYILSALNNIVCNNWSRCNSKKRMRSRLNQDGTCCHKLAVTDNIPDMNRTCPGAIYNQNHQPNYWFSITFFLFDQWHPILSACSLETMIHLIWKKIDMIHYDVRQTQKAQYSWQEKLVALDDVINW